MDLHSQNYIFEQRRISLYPEERMNFLKKVMDPLKYQKRVPSSKYYRS